MPIWELANALPEDQLHVVVFGPGYGESIAVHFPEGQWLVTDSLTGRGAQSNFIPALELLQARGEYAAAVILTHPHDDHAGGFDRLVTSYARGPVGVLDLYMPEEYLTETDYATGVAAALNRVKALAAISRYWRTRPEFKWLLIADGSSRPVGAGAVEVLHPDADFIAGGSPNPAASPNSYSTPLLVQWEKVRVVLGADLPTAQWTTLLTIARTPPLADHSVLKIAHHGSMKSTADRLVDPVTADASAIVTPWNLGRTPLPRLGSDGGLHWLLQRRAAVALTSHGRATARRIPHPVRLTELDASVERRSIPGGASIEVKAHYNPDESWVACSFGADGRLVHERYGAEARRVVP